MKVTIELPMPPTSNTAFPSNRLTGRRFCSEEYKAWKLEAGWILTRAYVPPFRKPVRLGMVIHGGKGFTRGCDLTNRWKALEDLLVKHGILKDDNVQYVVGHTDDYVAPTEKGQQARCLLTIDEIEGEREKTR